MITRTLLLLTLLAPSAFASPVINKSPLKATAHLTTSHLQPGANTQLVVDLNLAPDHWAYQDQFKLQVTPKGSLLIGTFKISPLLTWKDKFFKKIKTGVKGSATLRTVIEIPLNTRPGAIKTNLQLTYQACSLNYCLLPKKLDVPLEYTVLSSTGRDPTEPILIEPKKLDLFEQAIKQGWFAVFLFVFIAGVLTSFTPCVFPMIPITMAVIGSRAHARTKSQNFFASLSYVFGIAITYSSLGVFAASTGALFGAYMGHPVVVSLISLLFFLMALSMFGVFELQLPNFITKNLTQLNTGSGYVGAWGAGIIAGIVASPCVGPVLVGILTYVAKTQDLVLGFFLLFVFALGLGMIFIVLGTSSSLLSKLPKSGEWMNRVKYVFGVLMVGVSVYFAYPLIKRHLMAPNLVQNENQKKLHFQEYTEEKLQWGLKNNIPVIIDFWADWCAACFELEKHTFTHPKVYNLAQDFVLLKFNATENSKEFERLKEKYNIVGLPNLVFYDRSGVYRQELTLTGFEKGEEFYNRIIKLTK